MKKLIAFLLAGMVTPAWGGVYIYGTRVIYPEQKKEITVQLMNEGNRSALVQSWIDDGDTSQPPEKIHVPFVLTPPVAHVKGGKGNNSKSKNWRIHYLKIAKACSSLMCSTSHLIAPN